MPHIIPPPHSCHSERSRGISTPRQKSSASPPQPNPTATPFAGSVIAAAAELPAQCRGNPCGCPALASATTSPHPPPLPPHNPATPPLSHLTRSPTSFQPMPHITPPPHSCHSERSRGISTPPPAPPTPALTPGPQLKLPTRGGGGTFSRGRATISIIACASALGSCRKYTPAASTGHATTSLTTDPHSSKSNSTGYCRS